MKNKKIYTVILFIIVFILSSSFFLIWRTVVVQARSTSTSFIMLKSSINQGSRAISSATPISTSYIHGSSIGQFAIGESRSSSFLEQAGFQYYSTPINHGGGGGGGGGGDDGGYKTPTPEAKITATAEAQLTATAACSPVTEYVTENKIDFAQHYEAQWVAQDKTAENKDECIPIEAGEVFDFWVDIKNIGERAWVASHNACGTELNETTFSIRKDISQVKLAAALSCPEDLGYDDPEHLDFGLSYFHDTSWVGKTRIGTLVDTLLLPNEITRVKMQFAIPDDAVPGRYREDFGMAVGKYWIKNPINGDPGGALNVWLCFEVQPSN